MGFLAKLREGLSKTKNAIFGQIDDLLKSFVKIDEEALEELEEILICADVGVNAAEEIIDHKYFKIENTASMMIEGYMSVLQFYGNIDIDITEKAIEVINQIQENTCLLESKTFSNSKRME